MKGSGKGTNPKSKEALKPTQWKKGECGNPKGKPKGAISLKERMAKFLELEIKVELPDGEPSKQTVLDSIILSLIAEAKKGNTTAIKELFDRNFGKEPEKIEIDDKELRKTVEEIKDAASLLPEHDKSY